MRARRPDHTGTVDRDGVTIAYEVHGEGHRPTVVLAPTWSIVHSRVWKAQVPYLARHFRVVTLDGRGNGASDRPSDPAAYAPERFADDIVAVMDATGTERATLVSLSAGALWTVMVAADHPGRVTGLLTFGPFCRLDVPSPREDVVRWTERFDAPEGWQRYNRHEWTGDRYGEFTRFFFGEMFSEPHSTKQIEDFVGWASETDGATLVATVEGDVLTGDITAAEDWCARVRCPVLVVHGSEDRIRPHAEGVRMAELTGGSLVTVEGGGHGPQGRDPVFINHLIRDFVERTAGEPRRPPPTWTRALRRRRRALYLSSPIGLGHVRRDLAIARELRDRHPDLEIDWLAQSPVTAVLEAAGERVHPGSAWMASESDHIDDECADHDLHAFQAIRRMDEILVNNFMVFDEVTEDGHYDLVIGDEAWDVDHLLHENPERKRFSFAWMTDFVGWLPMPDGGAEEAALTADYNAEMIEQRARFRRVRDRSIFVGDPDDVVTDRFGPDLPAIRSWTEQEFDFAGYVTGFDPTETADRAGLRAELGYRDDERVCLVTVGGSGVGGPLLRRVLDAVPTVRRTVDGLRFVVVTGPRIDPASLPHPDGVDLHAYVPALHRHLAACDIAVVQGGLTTCMELTAQRRPFVYVPLRHHFEQNFHVRHRLDRYRAGRCLPYDDLDPDALTEAICAELARPLDYRPVATDGAARAAAMLAELL